MLLKLAVILSLATVFAFSLLAADSIELQIQKQYPLTALNGDGSAVVHAGTILVVQIPNIYGTSAAGKFGAYPNTYKGGTISHSLAGKIMEKSGQARPLSINEQVFLTKIDFKEGDVMFTLQTCGTCDPANPDPSTDRARAQVKFQFGKGALDGTDAALF